MFQKQLSMQEMFEKRRISLKKLAAKQTRPVQPVAPRPEAIIKTPTSSPGEPPKHDFCVIGCVSSLVLLVTIKTHVSLFPSDAQRIQDTLLIQFTVCSTTKKKAS